ncbi:MAG: metallophosphoesterase [Acidobacteriota bacterium]|nr:metallophosphoesterase [Acidobacteriota bacterium]
MRRQSVAPKFWKRRPLTLLALNAPKRVPPAGSFTADPEITETVIRLSRLPSRYDGLRIVHLTDIHLGLYTPIEEVERVVDLANRLRPDVVALTGDYVTFSPTYILPVAQALGRLRAPLGAYAVLGNHDFRAGAEEVTRALRAHHIRVLRNAHFALRRQREAPNRAGKRVQPAKSRKALWLVGVDDAWEATPDLKAALRSIPPGDAKILLCHHPEGIEEASKRGIDLMLSGHTHGGQVRLPLLRSLYRSIPGERFVDGWNQLGETQIYVSRGIGKVVVPLRVACRPEITCLSLRCA